MNDGRRGRRTVPPPPAELAELARTMSYRQMAKRFHVAQSTARAWFQDAGIDKRSRPRNGALFQRFGDDVEAIRRYIAARDIDAILTDLGISLAALYRWEREYQVRAMRRCVDCHVVKPFAAMVTRADGRPCSRCQDCALELATRKQPPPPRQVDRRERWAEPHDVDAAAWATRRMSRAQGINGWLRPQVAVLSAC